MRPTRTVSIVAACMLLAAPLTKAQEQAAPAAAPDAEEEPTEAPGPWLRIQASSAARLTTLLGDNAWTKDFLQSNLFRGLSLQVAPALYTLGHNFKDAWSGRLVDFLAKEILRDHPVELHHYTRAGLVSPIAVVVRGLGSGEAKVAAELATKLSGGEPVTEEGVKVQPVRLNAQRFAVAQDTGGGCLVVSRDPSVAASSLVACKKEEPQHADGYVAVDLDQAFPPVFAFSSKFFGLTKELVVDLQWKDDTKSFVPARAELPVAKDHALADVDVPPELLRAVPAAAPFFTLLSVPAPATLDPASVRAFLAQDRAALLAAKRRPVAFVYLPDGSTAALLSDASGERVLGDLAKLFDEKGSFELKQDRVCGSLVAITPSADALAKLRAACDKKTPSFADQPAAASESFKKQLAAGLWLDLGGLLAASLERGFAKLDPEAAAATPPAEVAQATTLLRKLPAYAFAGGVKDGKLVLAGVTR